MFRYWERALQFGSEIQGAAMTNGTAMFGDTMNMLLNKKGDCLDHSDKPLAVLVPGYGFSPSTLRSIADSLKDQMNVLFAPTDLFYTSVRLYARSIEEKIDAIAKSKRQDGVVFVGHSAGGAASVEASKKYNGDVQWIHAIATPFKPIEASFSNLPNDLTDQVLFNRLISGILAPIHCHVADQDSVIPPGHQTPMGHLDFCVSNYNETHSGMISGATAQRIAATIMGKKEA